MELEAPFILLKLSHKIRLYLKDHTAINMIQHQIHLGISIRKPGRKGSVLHKPLQETQSLPRPANRDQNVTAKPVQPPPKRVKYDEPPIWARRSPITAHIREQRLAHVSKQDRSNSRFQSRSVTPMPAKSPAPSEVNGTRGPMARPDFEETNDGPLGYWERCITNVEPYNDVTRIVTDFIYSELERRPDIDVTDVGGNVSPNGQIEIEAKLGTLVDRRNNERIRLPIVSSVILDLEARKHVAFESFMTEQQHKALNDFLNAEARKSHSRPPPGQRPRVKIHYEHKRERDSFHELTQAGFLSLPAAARNAVESQGTLKRTKVRVTKEQKTGRETARIVKCRLVDLDIYCPREAFDVRISINLEVGFQGELDDTNKVKFPDRVKDRLSYLHQAYQIDLTQVTDGGGSGEKTHELEVEVSSAEVRKQMRLLQEGRENELERLIKVFLDNVKVLSRAILPMG
ncbi:MAG: mRNA-capping enzyme subunit beta [Bathelium mastoideum]|nr:MAG: mRNA-capping enzyme subunit beta [Bathelium mastoideum]